MTKRNLFIAIGSTSTSALIMLIERLQDLGIYKPLDPDYKDIFIAIDTDTGPLERIKSYNKGGSDHAFGYHFSKSGEPNVASHKFLCSSYRPEWNASALKILEAQGGVGGKRYKSFATVEWQENLGKKIKEFYQSLNGADTLNDCKIILVASAWGGTASGMYQNVADFVGTKIYEECGSDRLTPFYTVLALPNLNAAMDCNKKGYQGVENFAYFMRSVQQAGWRGTLPRIMSRDSKQPLSFIFPELCDFAFEGDPSKIPVSTNLERFRGTDSPLPQRAIFAVPTQSVGTTSITVAEQLLMLVYLDVLKQPLNAEGSITADGKFVDVRTRWTENTTVDCPVLVGLNMVECQYPRGAAIKKVVEQNLLTRWKKFYSEQTSIDPHVPLFISDYLAHCVQIPEESENQLEYLLKKLELDWVDSNDRIIDLKDSIDDYVNDAKNVQYIYPNFDNAKELLAGMVKYAERLDDEDPQKNAFDASVTLQDIRLKYNEQLDNWYIQADSDEKLKLSKILKMVDFTVAEYNRLNKGKGFDNFIVKYCNGRVQVVKSFMKIAREEIATALKELQVLMLTKAIVRRWQLEEQNKVQNDPNWRLVDELLEKVKDQLADAEKEGERNRFIKSVWNEGLEASLKGLVKIKTSSLVSLLEASEQVAKLQGKYDLIRNKIQDEIDEGLQNYKEDSNSYKMITLADSNLTGCCPCYYPPELKDSMFHFYVKSAGAGDITWEDVERFGFKAYKNACLNGLVCSDRSNLERSGMTDGGSLGTWIDNNANYGGKTLCGMWFGSVNIGLTFREVLDAVYANGNNVSTLTSIQNAAFQLEHGMSSPSRRSFPQCCQSLFEKVAMGAVLGVINSKALKTHLPIDKVLTVTIKTPDGRIIWSKSSKNVADLGLISSGDGIVMQSVSAEFISVLMDWMREKNGSCSFADAFNCENLFLSLVDQERYVLTHMRLAPTPEQEAMLFDFYQKLVDNIELTVS